MSDKEDNLRDMEETRNASSYSEDDVYEESYSEEPGCSNPEGHEWVYTGTSYGGDDPRWCGEGRCYCTHCGADGDA